MKEFKDLSRRDQEASLLFPLIKELKRLGGKVTTKELKRSLIENIDFIPEDALTHIKTSKSGNLYHPFDYPFNFAVTNLNMAKLFDRPKLGAVVLTEKGRKASYEFEDQPEKFIASVYRITEPLWKGKAKRNAKMTYSKDKGKEIEKVVDYNEDWRQRLQTAINSLAPTKFEEFCRQLIKKMGVDIDEKIGINISGDGGIDGYGYLTNDDFRTTRVANYTCCHSSKTLEFKYYRLIS
ncbi:MULTISPECIES: winged helix-turn-helix domain-containing protein [unclassified Lactobacillus]|uniref:winged helix-turn-helix domain-containing protein n=1 Tax=unclassified Lactobacillus TaxID=2620435 RepID=UPI002ACE988A|nr:MULTISPECIES: winged helix-turn-helix domain-containing protein [unclassified Lactobacillus]